MSDILMATDPEADRLLDGIIDGFTAIPEIVWNHLKQADTAPIYNLSYLIGLLLLLGLLVWVPIQKLLIVILIVILVFILASA